MEQVSPNRQSPRDTGRGNEVPFDPEMTVASKRIRRERGELKVGDMVLGRYELLDKLGSGAMGVVFKCRDRVSKVEYALKMVPPELASDADAMEDVRENFQLIHGLKHPNIASSDFLDRDEYGAYFLIMEYAPGITLSQWNKQKWRGGSPDWNEVAKIVRQVASALDYAHQKHILHRDVKPTNVMVDEHCEVKVLDFGLASKVRNTITSISVTSATMSGTPCCLSPEQFKGRYPTPAADQYALGVLAYQMLAGHLPFDSDDYNVLRSAVVNEQPELIRDIPDNANRCIRKALSKYPKARYATCLDFAEDLTRSLTEQTASQTSSGKNGADAAESDAGETFAGVRDRHSSAQKTERSRFRTTFHRDAGSIMVAAVFHKLTSCFWLLCILWFATMILLALSKRLLPESVGAKVTEYAERIIVPSSPVFILLFISLSLFGILARKAMRNKSVLLNVLTVIGALASFGIMIALIAFSCFPSGFAGKTLLFIPPFLCLFFPLLGTQDKACDYLRNAAVKLSLFGVSWLDLFGMMTTGKKTAGHITAHR